MFRYDVNETGPELAAAGYEAVAADREFITLALSTSFASADGRRDYREAAENVFVTECRKAGFGI